MTLPVDQFRGSGVRNAKILYDNAGTVTPQALLFVRNVDPQPKVTTQSYEGEDKAEDVDTLIGFNVIVELDKYDVAALGRMYNKNVVTGITGEDWRLYFGDDNEVAGGASGLQYDVVVRDEVTKTSEILRYVFPQGSWKVFKPPQAQFNSKHGMKLEFTAERVTEDIAGNALPGVPTEGVYFYLAKPS